MKLATFQPVFKPLKAGVSSRGGVGSEFRRQIFHSGSSSKSLLLTRQFWDDIFQPGARNSCTQKLMNSKSKKQNKTPHTTPTRLPLLFIAGQLRVFAKPSIWSGIWTIPRKEVFIFSAWHIIVTFNTSIISSASLSFKGRVLLLKRFIFRQLKSKPTLPLKKGEETTFPPDAWLLRARLDPYLQSLSLSLLLHLSPTLSLSLHEACKLSKGWRQRLLHLSGANTPERPKTVVRSFPGSLPPPHKHVPLSKGPKYLLKQTLSRLNISPGHPSAFLPCSASKQNAKSGEGEKSTKQILLLPVFRFFSSFFPPSCFETLPLCMWKASERAK